MLAKCCHDIDFLQWITESRCRKVASFGSLRWFRQENAPEGSAARCVDCKIEQRCPFSAVDLYAVRKDWVANFDVPENATLDDVIDEELHSGIYGRCVYHCDNDVVDRQVVAMETDDQIAITLSVDVFTLDDRRKTHIKMTEGEIDGDELTLRVRRFRTREEEIYDFAHLTK